MPAVSSAPFFVVGCPRSGTTLLRAMLDAHPRLAVPPESHFVVTLWPRRLGLRDRPAAALEALIAHPRFAAWGLDPAEVRKAVRAAAPSSYADLISAVFSVYADAHGKKRWGDKTPLYGLHMPLLAQLFPNARFIHIIRDGREVAASLAARPSGAPNAAVGAFWWRRWVRRIRASGAALGSQYLEVRYEQLVRDPEPLLASICDVLDVPYHPAMLDYPEAVRSGAIRTSVVRHPNLLLTPRPGIRDWRAGLTARESLAVEAAAWRQLKTLGYEASKPGPTGIATAWLLRASGVSRTWPRNVHNALHPASRSL